MHYGLNFKKSVAAAATALMLLSSGCTSREVSIVETSQITLPLEVGAFTNERLVGVTTNNGDEIMFDPPGGTIAEGMARGTVNQQPYTIALADVQRLWIERRELNWIRTIGVVAGLLAVVAVVASVNSAEPTPSNDSCPFVYSWNGTQFVFDAEPYGGAITKGMERDDYSELENLREQDGLYRLLLTNEADETQFTNFMELWVADHPEGTRLVSDENGNLHAYTDVQAPSAARDRYGSDILLWLQSTDRKIWEPEPVAGPDDSLTQEIVLTFPKPEGATHAHLIVNAATGLWGSYMVKRMVELHGRETANYLATLDTDPASLAEVHAWSEREQTYRLGIEVEETTGWELRGAVPHGGPLVSENRVISLDVSGVRGDQLRVRMRPPVGFWAFNSFAVAYTEDRAVELERISPLSATTSEDEDVLSELMSIDDRYYVMPEMTDRAEIVFAAPPLKPEMKRTVFLHTRGWYELHLRNTSEPDVATFISVMTVPGAAVQFAADQYMEWQQGASR